jgi:hypothetical protein
MPGGSSKGKSWLVAAASAAALVEVVVGFVVLLLLILLLLVALLLSLAVQQPMTKNNVDKTIILVTVTVAPVEDMYDD